MKKEPSIAAVTFDVGGTLIRPWPSVGHVYATVGRRFGLATADPQALNREFSKAWKERQGFDHSRAGWEELVKRTFTGAGSAPPGRDCFAAIYEEFARASAWQIFDDVLPALAALKARGLRLALISNWDERLRPLLKELALAGHFEETIVSREENYAKPAREIFLRAAERLRLPPGSILHVGDSEPEDAVGARAAGMQASLLIRGAQSKRPHRIGDLSELVPVVL